MAKLKTTTNKLIHYAKGKVMSIVYPTVRPPAGSPKFVDIYDAKMWLRSIGKYDSALKYELGDSGVIKYANRLAGSRYWYKYQMSYVTIKPSTLKANVVFLYSPGDRGDYEGDYKGEKSVLIQHVYSGDYDLLKVLSNKVVRDLAAKALDFVLKVDLEWA